MSGDVALAMYDVEASVVGRFDPERFFVALLALERAVGRPLPRSVDELADLEPHELELYAHGAVLGLQRHMPGRNN